MKKIFILSLVVLSVISISVLASNYQLVSGNSQFVPGQEDIAIGSGNVNAIVDVYQWLNYVVQSPQIQTIYQPGPYTLSLASVYVSSNATLTVTYSISNQSFVIGTNIGDEGYTPISEPFPNSLLSTLSNGIMNYIGNTSSQYYTLSNPIYVPPSNDTNEPSSISNMTNVSLYWTGTVPYNTPAGQYVLPIFVTISTTVGF